MLYMNTVTTSAASALPPEFYYLANFRTALNWLNQRYADLLSAEEQGFIDNFARLEQPSQALLVRMVMRRGSHFRLSKLSYAEIGDCLAAAQPLLAHGWLSAEALLSAEELAELLRKDEMLAHLPLPNLRKSQSKTVLSEQLLALGQAPQSFRQWYPALADQLLSLTISELCDRLRLMFFGNLAQDWSEFVLADLGIYRYEAVDISPQSRGFQSRQDIDDYLLLRGLRQQAEQGAELASIVAPLLAFNSSNPYLGQRQSRLLFQLGQQLEKAGELEQALALYQRSQHGQARWRQVRVLELLGRDSQALQQAEAFAQQPGSDEETQRLGRALTRLRRRLGLSQTKASKALAEVRMALVLDQPEQGSVEWAVVEHLQEPQAPVFYLENTLLCSLFGLLCWDAIFAPLPGAFFHPFHSAPVDLYSADFVPRRQQQFADCLARLDQPDYPDLMLACYQAKYATQSPFVFWQMLDEALLKLALQCIPAAHLRACFTRLLGDLKANRAGMPDLIQFYPKQRSYRMIEVKGPGDRLQDNQKRWLEFAAAQGIAVEVCYVSWRA
jgi:tetratricopeptide (TPR) repeat protein